MFCKATRSKILLGVVPDSLAGMDQNRMNMVVNRPTEGLLGHDCPDVDVSSPRVDTGDFLLGHGGAWA